jgi:hypothetical protein
MQRRVPFLLAATAAALAAASGCNPPAESASTDPKPLIRTQVRTGVRPRPGGRAAARPHKVPMQTGPAQSSALRDL